MNSNSPYGFGNNTIFVKILNLVLNLCLFFEILLF